MSPKKSQMSLLIDAHKSVQSRITHLSMAMPGSQYVRELSTLMMVSLGILERCESATHLLDQDAMEYMKAAKAAASIANKIVPASDLQDSILRLVKKVSLQAKEPAC